MKDDKGLYYYPDPTDLQTRVYVRQATGGIEFRLWRSTHPEVWEKHGWLAYAVIAAAANMYKEEKGHNTPLNLYDINVAKALVKEEARKQSEAQEKAM